MGLVHAEVELSNAAKPLIEPITVRAQIETSVMMLCIPEHIAMQLELDEIERREVTVADGERRNVPHVGPLLLRFENRSCFTGALVLGDVALMGATLLDAMDVVISSSGETIVVNPESPNIPRGIVM